MMAKKRPTIRQLELPTGSPSRRRSLSESPPPATISERQASALCKERAELDELRLEANRAADKLKRKVESLEAKLFTFVTASLKTSRSQSKVRSVLLTKWRLSIVEEPKSLYYKGALEDEIGSEEFQARIAALGTKDVLQVEAI
jgi:hypothetical protein